MSSSNYSAFQPQGLVTNPASTNSADGLTPVVNLGKQNEQLVSEIHGKWYVAAARGILFTANVMAVTIPVIANGLVSVFSLYNPVGSGILMELVRTTIGQVLATTVVDAVGWYYDAGTRAAAATFTTLGTPESCLIGSGIAPKGKFYSALTHVNSAGWKRVDVIGSFGATTDPSLALPDKQHDGTLIIPEGVIMSVAMSTAAGTATGLDIQATWAEWPKTA